MIYFQFTALADQLHEELCAEFARATRELTEVDIIKFLFFRYCQSEDVQMFLSDEHSDLEPISMNNWVDLDPDDIVFLIKEQEYEVDIFLNGFGQVEILFMVGFYSIIFFYRINCIFSNYSFF